MGIAPLYYLSKKLRNSKQKIFLGAASYKELDFFSKKFEGLDVDVHLAAMEEKLEIKGSALVLWLNYLQQETPNFVYSCGPEKMLAAVEKECLKKNIGGELSVEKRMGCGIGVCLSCSCQSRNEENKNKRACVEGPVFGMGEVVIGE
jgi:dihydroorotate dehydrogenase electron transfer subunit